MSTKHTGAAFIAEMDRLDRLQAESEELQRIAYPATFPEVPRG